MRTGWDSGQERRSESSLPLEILEHQPQDGDGEAVVGLRRRSLAIVWDQTLPEQWQYGADPENLCLAKAMDGRDMVVYLAFAGDPFGHNGELRWGSTSVSEEPGVFFFDAAQDPGRFGPFGQYTGSSYFLSDLVDPQRERGLALNASFPEWDLSLAETNRVVDWAAGRAKEVLPGWAPQKL